MNKSKDPTNYWLNIIEAYELSGLSKTEFSKSQKITPAKFYYWCSKLRPDLKSDVHLAARSKSSSFVPLQTASEHKSFSITLKSGIKVEFDSMPDPLWIANLIRSVDSLHA